jgi:hypothetical protein
MQCQTPNWKGSDTVMFPSQEPRTLHFCMIFKLFLIVAFRQTLAYYGPLGCA